MPFARFRAWRRSLRFRLTLWNTGLVLVMVGMTLLALHIGLHVTLLRETDQVLREDAAEVELTLRRFHPHLSQAFEEMDLKARGHSERKWFASFLDAAGQPIWSTAGAPQVISPHETDAAATSLYMAGNLRVLQARLTDLQPLTRLRLGVSLDIVDEDIRRLSRMMWLVGAGLVVISPFGGYWLAGRATAPLAQMSGTADELRPGKLDERLPLHGTGDELDQLSLTINRLLDRIAEYLSQNREFIGNAAHELRSPLAAIQSSVEVALNSERSPAEYQDLLTVIAEECGDLKLLVNQLLLLAESDAGLGEANFQPVSLRDLVSRAVDMFRDAAEEQGIHLELSAPAEVQVLGDARRLRQVVNNLIDNGLKFNRPGGHVDVALGGDRHGGAWLTVCDDGPGIPAVDLPHLFERFYRGDRSRHREAHSSGTGLGLSICEAILHAHHATLTVESTLGQGATFRIRFPHVVTDKPIRARML